MEQSVPSSSTNRTAKPATKSAKKDKVFFVRAATLIKKHQQGKTPLFLAVQNGSSPENLSLIGALLKEKADPIQRNTDGDTPLLLACRNDDLKIVEMLAPFCQHLNSARGFKSPNSEPSFPLGIACKRGNRPLAEFLIRSKADVNDLADHGCFATPLECAVGGAKNEMVEFLIEAKANIQPMIQNGRNITSLAAELGNPIALKKLIEANGNVNAKNGFGQTPLNSCLAVYSEDSKWSLFSTSNKMSPEEVECVRLLVKAKCSINHTCLDGSTALTVAASEWDNADPVRILLSAKADANLAQQKRDWRLRWISETPLQKATKRDHREVIKVLVMEGHARLHSANKNGEVVPMSTHATPGSTTEALLKEMELTGADEEVLTKSATKRFRPLVLDGQQ